MPKTLFTLLATAFLISMIAYGQGGKPPKVTNPVVRAEFVHCGGNTDCETANRVQQDVAGSPYIHGVDGVSAEFNLASGSRDLTINMLTSQRRAALDFRLMVNAGTSTPTWLFNSPRQTVKVFINVLGAYYAKETCPPANSTCDYQARMNMGGWGVSGDNATYALSWNPTAVNRPVNSPDATSYVNVHYVRDDGSGREVFIITPIPNNEGFALAGLESTLRKTVTGVGQFDMPFTLSVRPK